MTTLNNFTHNPEHPDLELSVYWDTYQSQEAFDENFKRINNSDHLFLYTAFGNLPEDLPEPVIIPKEKNTMLNLAKALDELGAFYRYSYEEDIKEYSIRELCDELADVATFNDDDYFAALDKHNVKYTRPYEISATQGYSQGDYAEVIIPTEALKEVWGVKEVNMNALQETINHLFWDTPLYFHLTINEEEYTLEDFWYHDSKDEFEYGKAEFIESFMLHCGHTLPGPDYIKEWLEENLPVDPDYVQ